MVRPLLSRGLFLALCCLATLPHSHAQSDAQVAAQTSGPDTAHTIALTFDDLPETGDVPHGMTRASIGRALTDALRQAGAPPVYGFVNSGTLDDPDVVHVLERWREAGFLLGNHTFSHSNLDSSGTAAYEHDILRNEPVLRRLMPTEDWHWYRFPYLAEGSTLGRRDSIRAFLRDHGYRIAEVTVDSEDYLYNEPYARCLARHDTASVQQLKAIYLQAALGHLQLAQARAYTLFGRDIAHVMLLHFNGFEASMLPGMLDLLRSQGFKLVTLEQAEADPAYRLDPHVANGGATFLEDIMQSRHMPIPPEPAGKAALLKTICR